MKTKVLSRFTVILFVIGLMTAIQYNTLHEPDSRDTRDVWGIRQELSREKQLHSELLSEIRVLDDTLSKYEKASSESPEQALKETVEDLKVQAGLTEVTGSGIRILVEPSMEAIVTGQEIEQISPGLLIRFVNEVNRFNGLDISIDGKRIINTTAIRDINGETTVNGRPIQTPPFEIKIVPALTTDLEKLYNHISASQLMDDFYIYNLSLTVTEPEKEITVEAYREAIENNQLETAEGE